MNGKQFICNSSIMTDSTLSRSAKWLYVVLSFLYGQYGFKTGYFYRTNEQLEKYELSGNGIGIHWDELDEDVSVPNLLLGYRACRPRMVLQK